MDTWFSVINRRPSSAATGASVSDDPEFRIVFLEELLDIVVDIIDIDILIGQAGVRVLVYIDIEVVTNNKFFTMTF